MAAPKGVNAASNDQAPEGYIPSQDFFNPPEYHGGPLKNYWREVDRSYREGMRRVAQYEAARGNTALASAIEAHLAGRDTGAGPVQPAGTNPTGLEQGGTGPMRIDPELISEILRPSDRPDEPITTGLPFGPGPSFVRQPQEPEDRFRQRVAAALMSSPTATPEVITFARRLAEGR